MGDQENEKHKNMASCSGNGEHPLVYIDMKHGKGKCQYCGKEFTSDNKDAE